MDVPLHDSLDGQVALVTGASRGIGAAIADQLADLGATVYGTARDPSDVADRHEAVRLDVTDEATIDPVVDRLRYEAERLDVLVNNAAVGGPAGPSARARPVASTKSSTRTSVGRFSSRSTASTSCWTATVAVS